jgi:hypothetical protein
MAYITCRNNHMMWRYPLYGKTAYENLLAIVLVRRTFA